MSQDKNIKELIQELAGDPAAEYYSKPCEVVEVDEVARTCDVQPYDGTAIIYGVRLQAIEGSKEGLVIVPKKGSGVLVVFISKYRAFVALNEQLEKILVDVDEFTINGGNFGGLYKAPQANTELNKLKTRLTAIENALKSFATTQTSAATPTPLTPLVAGFTALNSVMTTLPPQGVFDDELIDNQIKH